MTADDVWIESTWDGTLVEGLAPTDIAHEIDEFRRIRGRAQLAEAIDSLARNLGADIAYSEAVSEASEPHLTVGRVHMRIKQSAYDLITQVVGLAIALVLHNPGGVVPAMQLVRTIKNATSLLNADEREVLKTVAQGQRLNDPISTVSLGAMGQIMIGKGILRDDDGFVSIVS